MKDLHATCRVNLVFGILIKPQGFSKVNIRTYQIIFVVGLINLDGTLNTNYQNTKLHYYILYFIQKLHANQDKRQFVHLIY